MRPFSESRLLCEYLPLPYNVNLLYYRALLQPPPTLLFSNSVHYYPHSKGGANPTKFIKLYFLSITVFIWKKNITYHFTFTVLTIS